MGFQQVRVLSEIYWCANFRRPGAPSGPTGFGDTLKTLSETRAQSVLCSEVAVLLMFNT